VLFPHFLRGQRSSSYVMSFKKGSHVLGLVLHGQTLQPSYRCPEIHTCIQPSSTNTTHKCHITLAVPDGKGVGLRGYKLGRLWASPFLVISTWTSSVCLSACHRPSTCRKSLPVLILRVLCHALIQNSVMEAISSACKRRWLECCHLSMPPPQPAACAGPACMLVTNIIARPDSFHQPDFIHEPSVSLPSRWASQKERIWWMCVWGQAQCFHFTPGLCCLQLEVLAVMPPLSINTW